MQRGHNLLEHIEADLRSQLQNMTVFTHLEPLEDSASWQDTTLDRDNAAAIDMASNTIELDLGHFACLQTDKFDVSSILLGTLQPGQGGHIAYIQMNNPGHLQKLMARGVLPGVPITLLRRFPSFVFEAGYSQFAVDEEIATDIYVRLAHD